MTKCPCKYIVSGRKDKDFCSKQFPEDRTFSYGVNSGGCCCPLNITYFFELMLEKESPENIFRFLTCHDVQLNPDLPGKLDGIIHDFACGLDEYLLNREAKKFQYLRVLVDGSHWQSQKRQKKPNKKGKGGHNGCSDGFNFNEYKKYLQPGFNSQGREQMHSQLNELTKSLQQMSYLNYMTFLKVWFAMQNLKNRGIY